MVSFLISLHKLFPFGPSAAHARRAAVLFVFRFMSSSRALAARARARHKSKNEKHSSAASSAREHLSQFFSIVYYIIFSISFGNLQIYLYFQVHCKAIQDFPCSAYSKTYDFSQKNQKIVKKLYFDFFPHENWQQSRLCNSGLSVFGV